MLWFVLPFFDYRGRHWPFVLKSNFKPFNFIWRAHYFLKNNSKFFNPFSLTPKLNQFQFKFKSTLKKNPAFLHHWKVFPLTWYWNVLVSEDTLTIVEPLALRLWIPSHETLERHSRSFSHNLDLSGRSDPGWFWNADVDFNIICKSWVEPRTISTFLYTLRSTTATLIFLLYGGQVEKHMNWLKTIANGV